MPADDEVPKADGSNDISLSVEETNKLRAKLGLRALDVGGKEEKEGSSNKPIAYMQMVQDKADEKKSKELQEKVAEMKRVRDASKKVMAKKGLGDASSDEEGLDHAAKWVQRSRKKQQEAAERQAKKMQEEEEQAEQQAAESAAYYNSNSLAGMKLSHEAGDFKEGVCVNVCVCVCGVSLSVYSSVHLSVAVCSCIASSVCLVDTVANTSAQILVANTSTQIRAMHTYTCTFYLSFDMSVHLMYRMYGHTRKRFLGALAHTHSI